MTVNLLRRYFRYFGFTYSYIHYYYYSYVIFIDGKVICRYILYKKAFKIIMIMLINKSTTGVYTWFRINT